MQTTDALVSAFERQTGITSTCAATQRTPSPTRSSPKGRGRRPTSSTPRTPRPWRSWRKGMLSAVAPSPCSTPSGTTHRPGHGPGFGQGERARLQHAPAQAQPAPGVGDGSWPSRSGAGSSPSPPARPTSSRSSPRSSAPTARRAALKWLDGLKANAGEPHLPRQRDHHLRGQRGSGGHRRHQPVLLVPAAGPARGRRHALGHRLLRPAQPRLRRRRLGHRRPALEHPPGGRPAVRGLRRLSQGQEIIAHSDSFEYPIDSGRGPRPRARPPSGSSSPTRSRWPNSGTGAAAISLLQEASCSRVASTLAERVDSDLDHRGGHRRFADGPPGCGGRRRPGPIPRCRAACRPRLP